MGVARRSGVGVEIDHHWRQQRLPLDCAAVAVLLELLVDDALMRRVLIDDDHSVRGLGDDVIAHAPAPAPRRAERQQVALK